ncbi:hypothetical protein TTHERM_000079489 (macronuclear) [Tetrahymena thermophila SB210]|uniref:Uncharacterized protein n=1 Tax=Tetrahymena thermophila (strain SB210) TaxID=312017 RepID=W7XIA3_TETTS|nr:hypothetical protein TTHERM_000079489 [Tetrahymena thermophila SB210]EWS74461.1 hypothetical protein TTHERM_000079489 [Tetrahymena thermophila SB210]|eukprot:XP_012653038.1 hypothetical protein TTHERM_000079489 [Tetrahymena thermophila SB210]
MRKSDRISEIGCLDLRRVGFLTQKLMERRLDKIVEKIQSNNMSEIMDFLFLQN